MQTANALQGHPLSSDSRWASQRRAGNSQSCVCLHVVAARAARIGGVVGQAIRKLTNADEMPSDAMASKERGGSLSTTAVHVQQEERSGRSISSGVRVVGSI